jgi:hypothetical protein
MKIAGITSDAKEGKEIEEIVKVFVIAKRMKNLPYEKKKQYKPRNSKLYYKKEAQMCHAFEGIKSSFFLFRGIN